MPGTTRVPRRAFVALSLLLCSAGTVVRAQTETSGLVRSSERGLTWVADPHYVVRAGLADSVVMPRPRALALLAQINAGAVENFGYRDWRLPTLAELDFLLAREHAGAGEGLEGLRVWLAGRRASPGDGRVAAWPVRGAGLPPGIDRVVILGTNSVRLKNSAAVVSGDVVAQDASPGPTLQSGYELSLDPQASTAAGYAVKGDSVRIKNNASVGGDVHYNELSNQGTIAGSLVTPLALPVFSLLPPFVAEPPGPGALDVTVGEGSFALLPSGDYLDVTVGAGGTLVLSGGAYNVRSVSVGTGAGLLFAAASEVRVEGRLATANDATVGPEASSGAAIRDLVIYVAGINGGDGGILSSPLAVEIGHDNQVGASFYAANGTLRLGHGTEATGAFLAADVLVENQAQITLDSFFFNRPPIAVDDSATVVESGTVATLDSGETSVLANDSDPNGDDLTVETTPVAGPFHGTLLLNADGTFSYTHDGGDASTSDSFVYRVCDNGTPTECATATVTIAILRPIRVQVVVFGLGSGRITSSPAGIDCGAVCEAVFPPTGTIELIPEPFGTSVFGGFSGDVDCVDATLSTDADKLCFARFDASSVPAILTVELAGDGSGQVVSSPAGISCPGTCVAGFPIPTRVELSAVADDGSIFVGWSGDAGCEGGEISLVADLRCTATFELAPPPPATFSLTIVFLGAGGGTVTSTPPGVLCGETCVRSFPQGTTLSLLARPDAGSFGGWGGDCAGSGFSTTVTLDADKVCTVTFDP